MAEGVTEKPRILIYGAERKNIHAHAEDEVIRSGCTFHVEPFGSQKRFDEFDGVIVFNGIFERFETSRRGIQRQHVVDSNELDRRMKEVRLLLQRGGFICVVLTDPILDETGRSTDLAKQLLNTYQIERENLRTRFNHITCKIDEFLPFFSRWGAAQTEFRTTSNVDCRTLATFGNDRVAMVIDRSVFFIPSLLPEDSDEIFIKFFDSLSSGLLGVHSRLRVDVPLWVAEFQFSRESGLIEEAEGLGDRISDIESQLSALRTLKRVLVATGDPLVDAVESALDDGLGLSTERIEEFKDDLKILDEDGNVLALLEVKGTNRSLKREYINQTDSHRERSGFDNSFPAILIINTLRSAQRLSDKDKDLPAVQVAHAARMNVLVMRTLDLLRLVELFQTRTLSTLDMTSLLTSSKGWLKVDAAGYEVIATESQAPV